MKRLPTTKDLILKTIPNFVLGNGKTSSYAGQWDTDNDGWHLLLFNKGKEARKFSVKVLPDYRKHVHCKFSTEVVGEKEATKIFVRRLNKEINQDAVMRSLEIQYEDTAGTSYSQKIGDMMDRMR